MTFISNWNVTPEVNFRKFKKYIHSPTLLGKLESVNSIGRIDLPWHKHWPQYFRCIFLMTFAYFAYVLVEWITLMQIEIYIKSTENNKKIQFDFRFLVFPWENFIFGQLFPSIAMQYNWPNSNTAIWRKNNFYKLQLIFPLNIRKHSLNLFVFFHCFRRC